MIVLKYRIHLRANTFSRETGEKYQHHLTSSLSTSLHFFVTSFRRDSCSLLHGLFWSRRSFVWSFAQLEEDGFAWLFFLSRPRLFVKPILSLSLGAIRGVWQKRTDDSTLALDWCRNACLRVAVSQTTKVDEGVGAERQLFCEGPLSASKMGRLAPQTWGAARQKGE